MKNCRSLALLLAVATVTAVPGLAGAQPAAPSDAAPSADAVQRAEPLFRRGVRLYSDKKYIEAEAELQAAWELNPTFDVAYNLGSTKYQLKKYREAAQYLSYAMKRWPLMKAVAELRPVAEQRLRESRAQVGAITVAVMSHVQVLVDGQAVGKAPLDGEVFVEPGEHQVEARLEGYETASQKVKVAKGGTATVTLAMVPLKGAASEPAAARVEDGTSAPGTSIAPRSGPGTKESPVDPVPPPPERSWVPVIALGAASVVGLGVGVGLTVASRNARSDADAQRAAIVSRGAGCMNASGDVASACGAFEDDASRAEALGTGALVAYAASGALAAGALVYALWPRSITTSNSVGVLPVVSLAKGDAVVGVVGTW